MMPIMKHRKAYIISSSIILVLAVVFGLFYLGLLGPHRILIQTTFAELPNWRQDDQSQAFIAFNQSCTEILKREPAKAINWQEICLAASKLATPDPLTARQFFETWFTPYRVTNNLNPQGMFTGYYLPVIHASLTKHEQYHVPIYGSPKDLVKINLGLFKPEWQGQTITGQMQGNKIVPYPTRAVINRDAIKDSAPVLAWADDMADVFFAHIQGSAIVELPDHQQFIISVSSTNGQPYTAIGKILVANGEMTKEQVSMQSLRAWLAQHPEQMSTILDQNASFVFFQIAKTKNPIGSGRVPLTPQRSLAVDTRYIPFGAPIWLDTQISKYPDEKKLVPLQRLVVAQDIGSAIKGVVRGDVYWGSGEEAAFTAGYMKSPGRYWILLPKKSHASS